MEAVLDWWVVPAALILWPIGFWIGRRIGKRDG